MRIQRYSTCNYSEFDTSENGEWTKSADTKLLEDENRTLKKALAELVYVHTYPLAGVEERICTINRIEYAILRAQQLLKGDYR